jgi:phosphonate transport system ATP-binding protein
MAVASGQVDCATDFDRNRNAMIETLRAVAAQGVAVIASLHQVQLAVTYADRIVALRAGRIVEDAPAARFDTRAIGQIYDRTTP